MSDQHWPGRVWRLRLLHRVWSDMPGPYTSADARVYEDPEIDVNQFGAVCVRAADGKWLGIRPAEMVWLSDPPWAGWPLEADRV